MLVDAGLLITSLKFWANLVETQLVIPPAKFPESTLIVLTDTAGYGASTRRIIRLDKNSEVPNGIE